jgi:hypothetical protein
MFFIQKCVEKNRALSKPALFHCQLMSAFQLFMSTMKTME